MRTAATDHPELRGPWAGLSRGQWMLLIIAACITAILSLGVHDMMLTRLNVTYPVHDAVPAWARYVDGCVRITSLVWFCRIAEPSLRCMTLYRAAALVGTMLVLLNETLRVFVVDIYLTKGWLGQRWIFTLAGNLPAAVMYFFFGAAATIMAGRGTGSRASRTAPAILATAAIGQFGLKPFLQWLAAKIETAFHLSQPPELYALPYPFHVYRVIYGMFIEPTVAAFVLVALVWPKLIGGPARRIASFVGLILLIRGRVVMASLFSFWVPEPLPFAWLSESQFFLETLVLALLSASTWAWIRRSIDRYGTTAAA